MEVCRYCNKIISGRIIGDKCQTCYKYFRDGGTVNPVPAHGKIEYDVYGKVICHICGRAYTRLGTHAKESHDMTIYEYKEAFGLCRRARTTESTYSKMMSDKAYENDMDKRLSEAGKETRIKVGDNNNPRKGKQVRLQEILNKKARYCKED